jgi:hypothetical protein
MSPARRLVSLAILLFFAVPFGLSVTGCKHALAVQYCNGGDSGPVVGQIATITLSPTLAVYGESLNYGQIGQSLSASAQDCKGNSVSASSYTYASTDGYIAGNASATYADINPKTGQVCAGTWNRNTGGGVADYTTCTGPPSTPPNYLAYVTATANGAVSNAIPVFIHPAATSIAIGTPSPAGCTAATSDPSSNCCPLAVTAPGNPSPYTGTSCLSQGATAQLVARVYANGKVDPADNITCQVGHLNFAAVGATNVVTIDENGVATANQPGSATITASISNSGSGSTAGFFSTCPPTNITLTSNGSRGPIAIGLNNSQPFTAVATDKNNVTINGLSLEYESTFPQTIPASGNTVQPAFPGTATITAVCQPGTCNPSPYSQINYQGNGVPLTSNGVVVNAAGTSSTVLYIGSTSSQYLYPVDFTTNQPATLLKLPYVPNSMVINQSGTDIYLGSSSALMTVSATNNTLASTNTNIVGQVISVSPDGTTLVTTDNAKNTITLVNTSGSVTASYGGVATHASWSPDSQTVYITTTTSLLLVHSAFTSWTAITNIPTPTLLYSDVVATVPHYGAYFAGGALTNGRSYCPTTTLDNTVSPPVATNSFYPVAETAAVPSDRLAATTDGAHILAATATAPATLTDMVIPQPTSTQTTPANAQCPLPGQPPVVFTTTNNPHVLTGVTATVITGVDPSSNSAAAFVTYDNNGTTPNAAAGTIPFYAPGTGALSFVKLNASGGLTPAQPVAGVWSDDNLTFYTGTSGDARVHEISVTYPSSGAPTAVDSGVISPALPDANGNTVTPNLLVQRPKKSTN